MINQEVAEPVEHHHDDDDGALDRAFMALADPVRRAIVARLSRADATVNELAEPFAITKQAVSKHIQVLEHAGLVTRSRDAQRRPVHLDAAALERLTAWIDRYRLIAEQRYRAPRRPARPHAAERERHMSNPTTITAARLPFVDIVREFDARPRPCSAPTPSGIYTRSGLARVPAKWTPWNWRRPQAAAGSTCSAATGDMAFSFHGVFHTVEPNTLLVQTFEFNLAPGQVGLDTTTFEEIDGRTRLSLHEVYPSVEARDMAVASGMESGIKEGYERLDEILTR